MTRSSTPRAPFDVGAAGRWFAPILSIVGLLVLALITLTLMQGGVPFIGGSKGTGTQPGAIGGPAETPAPPNVVIVPDVVTFPGSIVYAKAGNIWIQTGKETRELTTGGSDAMPSWSPDGTSIIFIRTVGSLGTWPSGGVDRRYDETTPSVMRINADGSGKPVVILSGVVRRGSRTWHAWIRQPVLSPDGRTLAIVSDRPDPTRSDVVLQFYDLTSKRSKVPAVTEEAPLGHQDPAWRSDGKVLLYVRNGRDGVRGAPVIYRLDVAKAKAAPLTGPGYLEPNFSPDGRYVAATKTTAFGNDLVILDAVTGRELMRVTTDGASWAPVWSPVGDSIAFLHIQGQIVDLKLATLDGVAPNWTVKAITDLTQVSGLDGASRPDWFVPPDQLPAPATTPVPSGATSSPTTSGSTTPQ
jgi:dipeptidyl aminopeptidase/acylaminoacyl peptidase